MCFCSDFLQTVWYYGLPAEPGLEPREGQKVNHCASRANDFNGRVGVFYLFFCLFYFYFRLCFTFLVFFLSFCCICETTQSDCFNISLISFLFPLFVTFNFLRTHHFFIHLWSCHSLQFDVLVWFPNEILHHTEFQMNSQNASAQMGCFNFATTYFENEI